jgi:DNA-binding transcriptional LysR family regulator
MTYLLPPLNALRAFEAAARHLSFTRAAHELHVTAGAGGQQVRALERLLGVSLFERAHNELTLTPLGRDYLAALSKAFTRLAAATAALRPASVALVRLGARAGLPMSGTHGLVAEVDRFRAASPDVMVSLSQPAGRRELMEGKVDMTIGPAQPGYRCDALPDVPWASARDCVVSPQGTADCPEIVAVRDWLLTAAVRKPTLPVKLRERDRPSPS